MPATYRVDRKEEAKLDNKEEISIETKMILKDLKNKHTPIIIMEKVIPIDKEVTSIEETIDKKGRDIGVDKIITEGSNIGAANGGNIGKDKTEETMGKTEGKKETANNKDSRDIIGNLVNRDRKIKISKLIIDLVFGA